MKTLEILKIVHHGNSEIALVSGSHVIWVAQESILISAPELLTALNTAEKIIQTARRYFPESIRNADRFSLELGAAEIVKAIAKAEGH